MNKEEQPRLSDEDIMKLDLESEKGKKLMKQYNEKTKRSAVWKGKETEDFIKWLKGEEMEKLETLLERERVQKFINYVIQLFEDGLKTFFRPAFDLALENLATVLLKYDKAYFRDFEEFVDNLKKTKDFDETIYPYSEILKIFYGDEEYREKFLRKIIKERNKVFTNQSYLDFVIKKHFEDIQIKKVYLVKGTSEKDDNGNRFPYPSVFKPPSPPGDLAMADQVQRRAPLKEKGSKGVIYCQYCGRKLTEEEQLIHSCKEKPKNT